MTDAPERIWVDEHGGNWSPVDGGTQRHKYLRADLVPALLAADRAAVIEAARAMAATGGDIRALSDDAVTEARAKIEANGYRRGLEAAAAICAHLAIYSADAAITGLPEQARVRESMEAALTQAMHSIRAMIEGGDDA